MVATQETTGEELRQIRQDAGLSMWDVASRLGIYESGLSLIERGRRRMPEGFADRYRSVVREVLDERRRKVEPGSVL